MSDKQVIKVSNSSMSLFDLLVFGCIIGWVMSVAGCDACKDTQSGTECFAKSVGGLYKELKTGFELGNK